MSTHKLQRKFVKGQTTDYDKEIYMPSTNKTGWNLMELSEIIQIYLV